MLKLLTAEQTRQADNYTILQEPVSSIDLMERAASAFVNVFQERYPDRNKGISVYCGTGNNGGDGLAIARLLFQEGYSKVMVTIARFSEKASPDFLINYSRIKETGIPVREVTYSYDITSENADILIDALLGTGLNKPLSGQWQKLVQLLNSLKRRVVSVDVPSGFKAEGPPEADSLILHAELVITFQRPKLNFLLPESAASIHEFVVADIGLDESFIQTIDSPYLLLTEADVISCLKQRVPFSHKGTYGHSLIIAGADETMGAALLCAGASLFAGSGLTTACIPSSGLTALNSKYPEVMALLRDKVKPGEVDWSKYQTAAVGPGLGTSLESKKMLEASLKKIKRPVVIDADAINLISSHYELMQLVPEHSIFTPHVKEFDRLFGEHKNWWERLDTGIDRAKTLGCTIVLKNEYTIVFTTSGECIFNPTGNPAMATGGMGDVLTGIIASFLAQGYSPQDAALLGVDLHGKTGDELVSDGSHAVIPASELLEKLPHTIAVLQTSVS